MRSKVNFLLVSIWVLSAVNHSVQRSTPESSVYTAAVVEYSPDTTGNETEVFQKNVDNYLDLISRAAKSPHNADIIVFPECGLTSYEKRSYSRVPEPSSRIRPCEDSSGNFDNLRRISCAARQHQIYVVINLYEIFPCDHNITSDYNETCPESGAFYYNTNVAFDRNGTVVARYRKFNLFGEAGIGIPPTAELITFDTDFGVTFGMFTCFDIMFEKPAVQLVKEKNIRDIIFPTAWFSELPFLTAVQAQAEWAHGMDANFLGSGYDHPLLGSAGSGIYSGRDGPLTAIMPSTPSTHLLVSDVTKKPRVVSRPAEVPTTPGIYMKRDNLKPYRTHLLDLTTGRIDARELCHGDFCCSFEVSAVRGAGKGVRYAYRLAVFNGVRSFDGVANGGMQICAVIACTNNTLASCGQVFASDKSATPTIFKLIRVRGSFKKAGTQLANTVTSDYQPLHADDYVMLTLPHDGDGLVTREMILVREVSPITFGIYGRDFSRDAEKVTPNNAAGRATMSAFGVVAVLLVLMQARSTP